MLTDLEVRRAARREKTYRISDGRGMYLEVSPSGGKYWRLKYRFNAREKRLALGVYPDVTLAHARRKLHEARALLADGVDPSQAKKERKRLARLNAANTFSAVAMEWFERQEPTWAQSHSAKVLGRLKRDVLPRLGPRLARVCRLDYERAEPVVSAALLRAQREEAAQQPAIAQLRDTWIAIVIGPVEHRNGRGPRLPFVGRVTAGNTTAARQHLVG